MSDFDFDEIDRAVNGVTGDTTAKPTEQSVSSATTPTVVAAPSEPKVTQPSSTDDKPELASLSARSAPAVRRSSGRFMDMVHSSSDMRTRSTPAVVPSEPTVAVRPSASATSPASVEVSEFNNDLAAIGDDWQKATESPFLPDTKVEKRPLGGGESIASSMKLEDLLDEPDNDLLGAGKQEDLLEAPDDPRIEAHTMPDPIDFAASLDEPATETAEAEDVTTPETPEIALAEQATEPDAAVDLDAAIEQAAPLQEDTHEEVQDTAPEQPIVEEPTPTAQEKPAVAEEPAGPTSISQQYKEQPSSKQESGAIYDTEAYHQPLAKAPKKRSGALAIVWILLLVLLGAGAGAAFYVYVLPML